MSRFEAVDDQYDPDAVEARVREYWADVDAYERTRAHRSDGEDFYFLDGPPYTSGAAHMGTTWNKVLKDAYVRYHRMCGYDVHDRPGYDMHGLPIETRVEEELGFENKKDIEAFGMEPFIEECKAFAEDQLEGLQADFREFGVWLDWDDPYKTVDPAYMEAAWWGFKRAHERGLVEQGKRSITQCPRCETAIAKNEVEYHEVEDPSIYVTFPLVDEDASLVIWTTTPWTIPANTFVAVDEDVTYLKVRAEKDGEADDLYVAEGVVEETLKKGRYQDYEVLEELSGADMVGWEYEHPLADRVDHPGGPGAFEVYHADYVEVDRTGLVHSAPGHGQEDFQRGQELGLDVFCPVGSDGVYDERAGAYAGQFVRDANDDIVADLEAAGLLLAEETYAHDYGQCWRCDTDIVFLATDQWFINVTEIKAELLENIEHSEWHPPEARDERFRNFVEESPDWNVSRQRYWGIPIPIWTPESEDSSSDGGGDSEEQSSSGRASGQGPRAEAAGGWSGDMADAIVVGSRQELAARVDQDVDADTVDLHRPTVDDLTITEEGTTYTRVPDVFDVWLDSSVASWGSLGYPGETDQFERLWPADLIMEAHDQTRGWFWSQLGMGTAALGEVPYDEVLMHGHALMPDGRAMSKSRGILVDPREVIDEHGVDPMRLFLLAQTPQGDDMRFSWEETAEMARRLNILWNVVRFPLPYMRLDDFDPEGVALPEDVELETVDRWVLSRLQAVEAEMADAWADRRQDRGLEALLEFVVEDVSRFYVQAVRERMWAEDDAGTKRAAYATTYRVLREVVALVAPYAPHAAEELHGTLTGDTGNPTVHMCDWPEPDAALRDAPLETDIELVRAMEEAGKNARQRAERSLRWPVARVVVAPDEVAATAAARDHPDLLAERLNAREVTVLDPAEDWEELSYTADADMSRLGPAFGDDAGPLMAAIDDARLDRPSLAALRTAVEDHLDEPTDLTDEMVDFAPQAPEGVEGATFDLAGDERGVVYVDARLTEDIESEGYAREVVRRVQEMRKELALDVEEAIRLELAVGDDRVADLVDRRRDLVAEEVRAAEFGEVEDGHRRTWTVEGVEVEVAIEPLAAASADD